MNLGQLLFSFSGRINRAKFWLAVLIYFIVSCVMLALAFTLGVDGVYSMLSYAVNVVVFISGLAVAAKRLHDRGKSAVWLLLFYILPTALITIGVVLLIGGVLWGAGGETLYIAGAIMIVAAAAVMIWAFIELGCLRGTVGPNQYGPDPLEGRL
jgi:uncharacterized membrane protein YhaH (DUF805 family)